MKNLSQFNISAIECKGKLLEPLQQPNSEIKFFKSLWRSLLCCLFVCKRLSVTKYVLSNYLTETTVMNLLLKAETCVLGWLAADLNGTLSSSPPCRER